MTKNLRSPLTLVIAACLIAAGWGVQADEEGDGINAAGTQPVYLLAAAGKGAGSDDYVEDEDEDTDIEIPDPLYYWNYGWYVVNDNLFLYLLDPTARGYAKVMPEPARESVKNFFVNLTMPVRFVSCVFQGRMADAGNELKVFGVNTTVGVLGLMNPARDRYFMDDISEEDVGQSFAVWGMGHGFYMVLPIFGPSSLRDGVGLVGDILLTPTTYLPFPGSIIAGTTKAVNNISLSLGDYQNIKDAAVNPYDSFRDIFLQYRAEKVRQ